MTTKIEAQRIANGLEFWDRSEDPVYQKMGHRCQTCDRPFMTLVEMEIDVLRWVENSRKLRCPNCGSKELYLGMNLSLSEDRARRTQSGDLVERVQNWLMDGETGLSSETLLDYMTKGTPPASYPHDYADLRRVILLMDRFPEWVGRMGELSEVKGWQGIAPRWEELVRRVLAADPEAKSPQDAREFLETIYER